MFAEINPAYLIASLFFLASGCYMYLNIVTFISNTKSKSRNDYLLSGLFLVFYSLFYGLMTISANDVLSRIFWAVGFTSGCMFYSRWLSFQSNMVTIKYKITRRLISATSFLTVLICALCVLSNDAVFIMTRYGIQFSYQRSPFFIIALIYLTTILFALLFLNFRWWRESEMKRDRTQALLFIILTAFVAPIGLAADFIIPIFTENTAIPLASICFLPVSMPFFVSMRKHKTLSITVPNASGYVFNTVTIPTLVLDQKNIINLENTAAFDFLGCSVIGKNISEIILSDDRTPEQSFFYNGFASEKVTVETPLGVRVCDMLLAVENDKYNDALCKVVLLRDITESEHKDIMLQTALEQANTASRAKSDFLSNMSHEIRTPMNAILGMTTIGRSTDDIKKKDYSLARINEASQHLLGVINDILDMSKIEANKLELSISEFNFERMLKRVVDVIGLRAEEKQQRIKVYVDRKIPTTLIGDDQRLAQVVTNLLGNAIKFTPDDGFIRIGTYFLGEEDGVCSIRITVTDTGIGISPEQQARLFQSFQQAENDTTRKFGGTGLGLVISKNIVEMMDGEIWVESELGKGATFAFEIKLRRGSKSGEAGLQVHGVNRSNVRILVIDDDADTLAFYRKIAEEVGISCDTAQDASQALDFIEANVTYNIFFIDWKLPGMDGVALAAEIKKRVPEPDKIAMVMFSAFVWSAIEDDAKKAGVKKFLSKPLFPFTIIDAIDDCLGIDSEQWAEAYPDVEGKALFKGHCILLAEDVEINREIVLALLEPTKLQIDCVENGKEAVRVFRDCPDKYGLIFMDVQMPEMDGYEATRAIRALDNTRAKNIPIIAMTANVFREDVDKCLDAGMNDHIGKPLDFDEVISQLRRYLHKPKDKLN